MKSPAAFLAVFVCLVASPLAHAQNQDRIPTSDALNQPPTYAVNVVSRTTPAVKYEHRSGATKIGFRGTDLMPDVTGEAKIQSERGTMKIGLELGGLEKPTTFGSEYLTYVLWAISPEGRPVNLGEVLVGNNHRTKLTVTTDLQTFALIVTAEPYFAVRRPSNVVIAENVIRPDTVGTSEAVDAKYELIDRGGYIPTGYHFDPVVLDSNLPLEFLEARNAVRIAKSDGADNYAAASYAKAVEQMDHADALATMKHVDEKRLIAESREVVQTAADSREIAVKRMDADRINAANDAEAAKLADSRANTRDAQQGRLNAEAATADANRRRAQADQAAADASQAAANANQAASEAQQGQKNAEAQSEQDRLAAANSDQQLQQAVQDREDLRAKLLAQFNLIFATRDTARGLIVNLSDVLFDTGEATLRPGAREKLAKLSGIILAYPDLRLAIEGNTDSVGSDALNQTLSEQRAASVRDYLVQENIPATSMTSQGFGKTQPVASNDTAEGRQENRRVELVVSGEVIGTTVGVASQNLPLPVRPLVNQ